MSKEKQIEEIAKYCCNWMPIPEAPKGGAE